MPASIIIPQKTNSDMTLNLVRQIHEHEPEAEVIVIHDTQDDEMDELPNCRLIRNRGVGVTAAWNHGIEEANHEHVILLNNDVICSGPFVAELYPNWDGEHGHSGEKWVIYGAAFRQEKMLGSHVNVLKDLADGFWLEGWCLSLFRGTWSGVGGFDEEMRLYYSDLDFQLRCVMKGAELKASYLESLQHIGHQTTHCIPGIGKMWEADRREFIRKIHGVTK